MAVIRITKEFHFEAAHALTGYDGPCKNIHGHSYGLSVTIKGAPQQDDTSPKTGMIMDFSDLKKMIKTNIIDHFDHALILNKNHPHEVIRILRESFSNLVFVDYQPTSENLLADFAERIRKILPEKVELAKLRLRETGSSFAEWRAEDNE